MIALYVLIIILSLVACALAVDAALKDTNGLF
jgi:hypothetical protein